MIEKILAVLWFACKAAGLMFIVWNIFAKGKPAIALTLAINDWLHEDHKAFKGYGYYHYVGLGGSGKTISMVDYATILHRRYPKLKIISNFDYEYANENFDSWQQIVQCSNYEYVEITEKQFNKLKDNHRLTVSGRYFKKQSNGVLVLFDEQQLSFDSTKWKDTPENVLTEICQQRKAHKMTLASSQTENRVDIKYREQSNAVIECKCIFKGRLVYNKFFDGQSYKTPDERKNDKKKPKCKKRYSFVAYDYIRELYDTEQMMINLFDDKKAENELLMRIAQGLENVSKFNG